MTQIDFYQIETDESALMFACRLIDKIYHQGRKIHIHTSSQSQSEEMDDLLWSFRPDRFIPHVICALESASEQGAILAEADDELMVKISHQIEPNDHHDILVNMSGLVPDFFSRFDRVTEIVPFDEGSRSAARENYKFYQDRGYMIKYHAIKAKQPKVPDAKG